MRSRRVVPAVVSGVALLAAIVVAGVASAANSGPGAANSGPGAANSGPGAAAAPNPGLAPAQIIQTMKLVDTYWVAHGTNTTSNNWQNSTFHVGNLAYVTAGGASNHVTLPWATRNHFALQSDPNRPFFPDFEAAGEVYLDLEAFHPDPSHLAAIRKRVADENASIAAGHIDYVNYVDALNMALPSFARLGVLDHSQTDLNSMQKLFNFAEKQVKGRGLFSETAGLWWRDGNYVGTNTFWSRGNGWAIMAMAKLAKALPASDPRRAEFVRVLTKMAAKLRTIQRSDGFWNVDLGNPNNFAGPETSGTAFFTYAIAWGINNGILPASVYRPVVEKAWQGMVRKAVHSNGLLGFVQGPGSKPADHQPVKSSDTAAYGVGGFLLAGSQLVLLEKPAR
jgi:rhamnogalacturonyl hydrolase YesR